MNKPFAHFGNACYRRVSGQGGARAALALLLVSSAELAALVVAGWCSRALCGRRVGGRGAEKIGFDAPLPSRDSGPLLLGSSCRKGAPGFLFWDSGVDRSSCGWGCVLMAVRVLCAAVAPDLTFVWGRVPERPKGAAC